tara:strand:- start:32 stop:430 length:399 start_codon:yes stop_codon:yes gene_type:complete
MKSLHLAIVLIASTSGFPLNAGEYQPGYSKSQSCVRNEYREEYIPGDENSPGYVKTWTDKVKVPCNSKGAHNKSTAHSHENFDNNDCSEGSLIGGILGAGLATSSTRGKDRWWAIPAGALGGAMLGCQVDGG